MPSLKPQRIHETDWYYEYPTHCLVVHEVRDKKTNAYIRTDSIQIPWRKLKASIARSYRPRKRKGVVRRKRAA